MRRFLPILEFEALRGDGPEGKAMAVGRLIFSGALVAAALAAAPAQGQRKELAMLDTLERGNWELRERGDASTRTKLCLTTGRELIQLRHPGPTCGKVIVADTANEVTVQYTCPGRGFGRTRIRRESDDLIQLDSQGIVNGVPFAFAAEGRKVGSCGS